VRTNACEALASIARDEPELVVEALGDALSDAHRAVRVAAAKGLWQLGKGAAPAETHIRASLNDIDDEVVRWARRALKTLEDH
jgi:HEAT repeat protein